MHQHRERSMEKRSQGRMALFRKKSEVFHHFCSAQFVPRILITFICQALIIRIVLNYKYMFPYIQYN